MFDNLLLLSFETNLYMLAHFDVDAHILCYSW